LIVNKLSAFPSSFIQSITYDNGNENAEHLLINRILGCKSYFCQPYHSWEKGAVEQVNGLIRRYLPKGTDMKLVDPSRIKKIENLLNNRPRRWLVFEGIQMRLSDYLELVDSTGRVLRKDKRGVISAGAERILNRLDVDENQ